MKFAFFIVTLLSLNTLSALNRDSIVEAKDQISDFEARFEFAKLLSHHKESSEEALKQYDILLKEKPQNVPLWLEISRLYITQEKFSDALDVLSALVYQKPLHFKLNLSLPQLKTTQTTLKKKIQSLVSENLISDDQARLELARILSKRERGLEEAIGLYQILLQKQPDDATLLLEISRLYIRQKNYGKALSYLYFGIDRHPCSSELLVAAAHAELGLEHAKRSRDLLAKALKLSKDPEPILMDQANVFMMVGSFYKAEAIYRRALNSHPHSLDLALKLAWALVSAQRYEEAEGLYRSLLLDHPDHPKILEPFITLKMFDKDFKAALDMIATLMTLCPRNPLYIELKANALYKNESYADAIEEFDRLTQFPKFYVKAWIGKGRAYEKLGDCINAVESFRQAYDHDPSSIQTRFYQSGIKAVDKATVEAIIRQTNNPKDLIEWGNVYSENGMGGVIEFYEAALNLDPDYFPAQASLAEALSAHYRYDEAIEVYLSILDSFPENSKMMTAIARVLSWGKNYECSMAWYNQVIALNPQDPLPKREIARVAYWGKFFERSMELYQELLYPPVDRLLLNALQALQQELCSESFLLYNLAYLEESVISGSIYSGYKIFLSQFTEQMVNPDNQEKLKIERILIDYLPLYRIQRAIFLERQVKYLDWQNYYLHALPIYQELADFSPGNQEGLYGYAQDFCAIGQCKCSRQLYYHLLNLEPNSSLVKMALERNLMFERPLIQNNYYYWTERGSGQFSNSQIARHQLDELFEWSPRCNQHFRFMQSEWLEYPFYTEKYYPAEGQTIEADQVFNEYVKGTASVTRKNYFGQFPSLYTGLSNFWFNLYDYMQLGIGFERKNEIYNYFTLKQGIQANVYWASLKAFSHSWNIMTTYRHLDYNDHNTMDHINLTASYAFTEDPQVFKVILDTSYRNTAHLTRLIINPEGKLITIIHPYWTPQDYYSGSVTLEFRYNYAWFNYCEAPQRFVDIKLTGETDTAHNPSIQLAINWKHEFMYDCGFEVTGLFHRSKLWNADGIWTKIYYRF